MGESVGSKLEMVFLIDDGIHVGMIPKQNMAFFLMKCMEVLLC